MKNIVIYSTPNCVHCSNAKEFFKENNVSYTEKDVAQDQDAQKEMIAKTGQLGVPVIDIEGKIIIGFDKEAVVAELNI